MTYSGSNNSSNRMRTTLVCLATILLAFVAVETHAFVKGSAHVNSRPVFLSSTTELGAVAKKKAAKKKAVAAKKKKATDVETMRKADVVASIAEQLECTKTEADAALAAVLGTISQNVVAGKKVTLPGFGSFQLRARAARKGRNPQTGEEIDIKASNSVGFSVSKGLKDAANE